ncbi:hypothetical protein PCIT_b0406 [Pseudoalteromonas citrea]|uniref:Uncharacterized protein n=1 Tax=Pseudoalteromonas citrea TaxID=43655 RepID=A0AAD4AED5_9GAMM|nr:hypothetical protein PCIT_b0406 [Pseudoalteromonas citrea]
MVFCFFNVSDDVEFKPFEIKLEEVSIWQQILFSSRLLLQL